MAIGGISVVVYFAWFLFKKSSHKRAHATFIGTVMASFLGIFILIPFLLPNEEEALDSTQLSVVSNLRSIDGTDITFNASEITDLAWSSALSRLALVANPTPCPKSFN